MSFFILVCFQIPSFTSQDLVGSDVIANFKSFFLACFKARTEVEYFLPLCGNIGLEMSHKTLVSSNMTLEPGQCYGQTVYQAKLNLCFRTH